MTGSRWICAECQRATSGDACDHCGQLRSVAEVTSAKPRLLGDGGVLVAYRSAAGETTTRRFEPGDREHGEWVGRLDELADFDERVAAADRHELWSWLVPSLLLPVVAVIPLFGFLRRGAIGAALVILAAALASLAIYAALLMQ